MGVAWGVRCGDSSSSLKWAIRPGGLGLLPQKDSVSPAQILRIFGFSSEVPDENITCPRYWKRNLQNFQIPDTKNTVLKSIGIKESGGSEHQMVALFHEKRVGSEAWV